MAAVGGDVFLDEEAVLDLAGVEVGLHQRVVEVFAPADEVVDGHLGAVGVVDFEAVALGFELVADLAQAFGGLAGEERRGLEVALDARADEVVGAVVAYFEYGVGHGLGEGDEIAAVGFGQGAAFAV